MTQAELAVRLGCSQGHLSAVERGQTWPSTALVAKCDEICATGGRLLSILRDAKVPALSVGSSEAFTVGHHSFVPVVCPPGAYALLAQQVDGVEQDCYLMSAMCVEVETPSGRATAYYFPFNVAVLHYEREMRVSSISELALERRAAYEPTVASAASFIQEKLDSLRARLGSLVKADYLLTLLVLRRSKWSSFSELDRAVRLLCTPSILLPQDASTLDAALQRAIAAETELMTEGFEHSEIVGFGVRDISLAYASWAGVSYCPLSGGRALEEQALVRFEVAIQALWCYCNNIIERSRHADTPLLIDTRYGKAYLRSVLSNAVLPGPREVMQFTMMREAIFRTSRLATLINGALEVLA